MTTVLFIDPSRSAQKFIQTVLGQTYNVVSVADSPTAIQYCAMIQPDLVLVDFDAANIDLSELTLRLKMFMPQLPILIFGEYVQGRDSDLSLVGIDGVLSKTVAPEIIRQTVQSFLPQPERSVSVPESLLGNRAAVEQFEEQIAALNQANQRLASLNAISALIGTSLDLEHLTDEILQQIYQTIDFDSATLFLLKGNILEAAASRGLKEYRRGLNVYHKSDRNSAWQVVNNKLPLVINDVTRNELWEPRPELLQVRAWLGVPLVYKDRVVGVLTLDKNETNAFTDADARYVFTLAFQIAIAVENAQLFEEWESQSSRLKLVNEVNLEIATILDVASLYSTLAKAIVARLQYDRVAILEINPARTGLILRACFHGNHDFSNQLVVGQYQHSAHDGIIGRAVKTGRPLLVNRILKSDVALEGLPAKSALVVPIFVDNKAEAVIYVDSLKPDGFNDQDLWTLSSLGTHTATVIENARLYHHIDSYSARLQRTVFARNQRLQAIKKISRGISRRVGVDELLEVVGQSINQIFAGESNKNVQVAAGLLSGSRVSVRVIYNPVNNDKNAPSSGKNRVVEGRCRLNYQAPAGQVISQARSRILNNVYLPEIFTKESSASPAPNINSLMMTPLITAGKTIGLISVTCHQEQAFDEDDLETLESVAFQVASAIEYARLLRKTKEMAIVDERTRLARDMHDGVAQNLAYLLIQVDRCLNMVDEGSRLEQHLESIGRLLEHNIDELRRNIFDLRPVDLEGKSLFEVFENFVAEFGRRWNLRVTCSVTGRAEDVSPEVESSLFRILQEALSNARQHALCKEVSVTMATEENRWIILYIEDDGRGFDPVQLQNQNQGKGHGLGLISMRERAESVGGQLTVKSVAGQGTQILAQLPFRVDTAPEQI